MQGDTVDAVSEKHLLTIYPELARRVRLMAAELAAEDVFIRVTQAFRTWEEQQALYEQGRSRAGSIVTNARPGESWHNFGLAVDVVPSTHGPGLPFDPDWNVSHPVWKKIVSAGEAQGLTAGADWRTFKDYPHFQLTGRFPVSAPDDEVRQLYQQGFLSAVWNAVTESLNGNSNETHS